MEPNYIHAFSTTNFFSPAAPLINKTVLAIWEWVRVRVFPRCFRMHYLIPLPVITPIWRDSHSNLFTLCGTVCLLFALGTITFDISRVEEGGGWQKTPSGHQLHLPNPTLHTQNLPNPLTANEHSCSLGHGDLNSGFVMTLAWCSKAFQQQQKKNTI